MEELGIGFGHGPPPGYKDMIRREGEDGKGWHGVGRALFIDWRWGLGRMRNLGGVLWWGEMG